MADSNETTIIDDPEALERMATLLEASDKFKILRRLEPRAGYHVPDGTPTRRGIFLDVETTGLDSATDEIVELAMVPFDFTYDGRIFAVHECFSRFRDPGRPIAAAVTALTGITEAMVAGASIDPAEVEAFLGPAAIVIAHNAGFDRRFMERFCSAFVTLPWACSWAEVPWSEEGFHGAKLTHLAAAHGFFHDGHRAVHDCHAGVEILARTLPRSGRTALDVLLESARHGFAVLLTWKTLALMMVGLVLGIFVGVLPGLRGPNGVAILLLLTFTMDPTSAIVMLSSIY